MYMQCSSGAASRAPTSLPRSPTDGVGDRVTVHHDVSDDDFRAWLVAADIAVDLRFPHRGEVSGSLSMAMVAGVPTIVSGTGTYLDIPEGLVVRVAPGHADPAELAARIGELRDDPERRAGSGDAARAHMAGLRDSNATATGYEQAILATRDIVLDPTNAVMARWAASLAAVGRGRGAGRGGLRRLLRPGSRKLPTIVMTAPRCGAEPLLHSRYSP